MSDGVREAFALSREGCSVPGDELTRIWFISSGTLRSEVVMMLNREIYYFLCSDCLGTVIYCYLVQSSGSVTRCLVVHNWVELEQTYAENSFHKRRKYEDTS
jgi:hypothetical protein